MSNSIGLMISSEKEIYLGVTEDQLAVGGNLSESAPKLISDAVVSSGVSTVNRIEVFGQRSQAGARPAAAICLLSGAAGAVGFTLGQTSYSVVAAGGDVATATSLLGTFLVTQISSPDKIRYAASNIFATLSVGVPVVGNSVVLAGMRFTGVPLASAAIVAGQFRIGASGAASAANLAAAINRDMAIEGYTAFTDATLPGTIFVMQNWPATVLPQSNLFSPNPATIVALNFAAVAGVGILTIASGELGNLVNISPDGAGSSIVGINAGTKLFGGVGISGDSLYQNL